MRTSKQKKLTKQFFNAVADEWYDRTYNPSGDFVKFPSNKVRMEVVLKEIVKLGLQGNVLDIGCGAGQLVIELLKKGYDASGIDIADEMIARAEENLKKSKLKIQKRGIFKTADLAEFRSAKKYKIATALGLLEYLKSDAELFSVLDKVTEKGGYVLAECRNKFFNLFSMNEYTLGVMNEIPELLRRFGEVQKYSAESDDQIPFIEAKVSKAIAAFLSKATKNISLLSTDVPNYSRYPQKMIRRQHTPQEIEASAKKFGFELLYVIYWHVHPYAPAYEKKFPRIYNKMSYLMTPLGRTSLGAYRCSSFSGVFKKK